MPKEYHGIPKTGKILIKPYLESGAFYIELPKWIKSEEATIIPAFKYKECFKYALIVGLHYYQITYH